MLLDARSLLAGVACGAAAATLVWKLTSSRVPARGLPRQQAPVTSQGVLAPGKVAVIIGSGSGIGRCAALRCVSLSMKVMLCDIDVDDAASVRAECIAAGASADSVVVQKCDCREEADVHAAKKAAFAAFGAVHFLMNNAAIQSNNRCGPYEHLDRWRTIINTNLWGVYLGGLAFTQAMIEQAEPAVIVNTGSKQGITMPPGDTAYNVSKAGVKVLTEALQHQLRSVPGCKVNAFLLVPGCVNTMIRTRGDRWIEGADFKPDRAKDEREYNGVRDREYAAKQWTERGAWQPDLVIDELFGAIEAGTPFYVICQDHETTRAMDDGRIQWAADDLVFRRAPLSRWSDDFKEEYARISKRFV
uniref:Uncharacterized protein n=1 Tax=Coccolithus braarudii TaxID=221442 RepID=A0A7S0L4N1_9EUKA|mmetsp:Transcript_14947/g.32441  ORF Transcript_14947/g.32441 Transcript_14947/m.32441 type:complete len:359 (+) Transcript_14947:22-1098(+)|eukprot:CAMPEP_0183355382 /NCGR_PEP_ID=MMETSP0164_2-20130417/40152_1 /TAXON_ID=221442 /ORGANISM="Coccolithus pelagicus ssp braarudi, Strain PLY182g" /LENGTH=358 /DNA_ID=CAMNT_0025528477 /DNA_START=14 /DNA_END=1090 /DNA_ORIENTATION=+